MENSAEVTRSIRLPIRFRGDEVRHRVGRLLIYTVIFSIACLIFFGVTQNVYQRNVRDTIFAVAFLSFVFFTDQFAGIRLRGTPFRIYFPYLPSKKGDRVVEIHFLPSLIFWKWFLAIITFKKSEFRKKINLGHSMLDQAAEAVNYSLQCGYKRVSVASHLIPDKRMEELIQKVKALNQSVSIEIGKTKNSFLANLYLMVFANQRLSNLKREYPKITFTSQLVL